MQAARRRDGRVWATATLVAILLCPGAGRAQAEPADCAKAYDLAKPADVDSLVTKLMAFGSTGLTLALELSEPKFVKFTAAALGAAAASYELVGLLKGYFGPSQSVHVCPGQPGHAPVIGTDPLTAGALAFGNLRSMPLGQSHAALTRELEAMQALTAPTPAAAPVIPSPRLDFAAMLNKESFRTMLKPPPGDMLRQILFSAAVSGRVTDAATGAPVLSAVVKLDPADATFALTQATATAPDGSYRFEGLGGGTYRLSVHSPGYADAQRRVSLDSGAGLTGQDVTLAHGQ